MDQRTRKLITMHKALHPRDDVDRLYVSRKQVGRGLASIEDSVDTSIQRLEDYMKKHEGGLITAIRNNTDNTMDNRMTITRKLLKTKLSCRNFIKRINTWAVPLVRYSGPFLKWTRDEMDQIAKKLMTMHKALHPRDDVDRLYVSRKEGGRGLASIEDSFDT